MTLVLCFLGEGINVLVKVKWTFEGKRATEAWGGKKSYCCQLLALKVRLLSPALPLAVGVTFTALNV